jgi:hypothetical protein
MQPNDPLAEYGPEDVKPAVDLKDEVACREWMAAMFVHESHHLIVPRILEIDEALTGMSEAMRGAWAVNERLRMTTGAFRLQKPARDRVAHLIERGKGTPYGAELARRMITEDHQIVWFIHANARPHTAEKI